MQLYSLSVQLDEYSVHKGSYVGHAWFKGEHGEVKVILSPDLSKQVLKLCADALVKNSRELAEQLTAETMTQAVNVLPSPF